MRCLSHGARSWQIGFVGSVARAPERELFFMSAMVWLDRGGNASPCSVDFCLIDQTAPAAQGVSAENHNFV